MPFSELLSRFALTATLTTAICVPLGLVLLRICGVPASYPPLLPQQVLAGSIAGALLVSLGYGLMAALLPDWRSRHAIFLALAVLLLCASFYLPYRLTYTTSPRFAGVTSAALIGQAVLHTLVVMLSVICFVTERYEWY